LTENRFRLFAELIILLLILLLAAYLRLTNVSENPGWYTDEGTLIDIAQHLREGKVQYLAVNQSFLMFGRPPLFVSLLALLYNTGGEGIQTLRILTGLLGVVSVGGLWWFARCSGGSTLALIAALLLAIYPNAVTYSRIGFSYILLAPLILLAAWGMWEYLGTSKRSWLAFAAVMIGLGCTSDLMMFNIIPPFLLVVISRRWRDLLWSVPLLALPFALYVGFMLMSFPSAFLFDLQFTFGRIGRLNLIEQVGGLLVNITRLLISDAWVAPSIIGIFMLQPVRLRRLVILLLLLPLVTLGRTVGLSGVSYYYITPLLPLVALGGAALIRYGTPPLTKTIQEGFAALIQRFEVVLRRQRWLRARLIAFGTMGVIFLFIVTPFLMQTIFSINNLNHNFTTSVDNLLVDPDAARAAAVYINEHVRDGESVIASPAVGWLLDANVADFQMMLAYDGISTVHLPGDLPHDRYAFSPRYTDARFVVMDNIWTEWAILNLPPELGEMVDDVETHWTLVFEAGAIRIYENPEWQ
jgi:4-amino-4-deoxy-L-arabinose transferase-like glycosyltransferase